MIALSKHPSVIHTSIFPCPDQAARLERPRQWCKYFICAMFKRVDIWRYAALLTFQELSFSHMYSTTTIIQAILCIQKLNLLYLCKEHVQIPLRKNKGTESTKTLATLPRKYGPKRYARLCLLQLVGDNSNLSTSTKMGRALEDNLVSDQSFAL
jgi:hypothetical protein